MKSKREAKNVDILTEWITGKEAMAIIRNTSRNGLKAFARRHNLTVNNRTGRDLYKKHEVYEALERGAVRLGV